MSNQCNCNSEPEEGYEVEQAGGHPPVFGSCPLDVHQTVSLWAKVKIDPKVYVGKIKTFCVGDPSLCADLTQETCGGSCTFFVKQDICVEVPLTFAAQACAEPLGHVCHMPGVGGCCDN